MTHIDEQIDRLDTELIDELATVVCDGAWISQAIDVFC